MPCHSLPRLYDSDMRLRALGIVLQWMDEGVAQTFAIWNLHKAAYCLWVTRLVDMTFCGTYLTFVSDSGLEFQSRERCVWAKHWDYMAGQLHWNHVNPFWPIDNDRQIGARLYHMAEELLSLVRRLGAQARVFRQNFVRAWQHRKLLSMLMQDCIHVAPVSMERKWWLRRDRLSGLHRKLFTLKTHSLDDCLSDCFLTGSELCEIQCLHLPNRPFRQPNFVHRYMELIKIPIDQAWLICNEKLCDDMPFEIHPNPVPNINECLSTGKEDLVYRVQFITGNLTI